MNKPMSFFKRPSFHTALMLVALPCSAAAADKVESGTSPQQQTSAFVLRSSEVADGGTLPKDYTGDGTSSTLPLEWSGAPAGTKTYALIMHHNAPDAIKWYWILYNIPADVHNLPKNVKGVGTLGSNSVNNRGGYAPPHSKGPGAKTYILTVYALSAPPDINVAPLKVNREVLLAAMKDKILSSAELKVVYSRPPGATDSSEQNRQDGPGGANRPPRNPNRPAGERRPPPEQ